MSCSSSRMMSKSSAFDYNDNGKFEEKQQVNSLGLAQVTDDDERSASKSEANPNDQPRIILYNAQLSLLVDSVKTIKDRALSIMVSYKGYMVSSTNTYLQMRVPSSSLNSVLTNFKQLGKVNYENINGVDVTDTYYDIKIRLENAEKTRNRYLELLNQAKNVSEILKVEKELERLNGVIDSYKGSIKRYDQENQYSLITLRFYTKQDKKDKVRPGPLGYIFVGLYKGIKWLFVWD